jgi:hypothetical protein
LNPRGELVARRENDLKVGYRQEGSAVAAALRNVRTLAVHTCSGAAFVLPACHSEEGSLLGGLGRIIDGDNS